MLKLNRALYTYLYVPWHHPKQDEFQWFLVDLCPQIKLFFWSQTIRTIIAQALRKILSSQWETCLFLYVCAVFAHQCIYMCGVCACIVLHKLVLNNVMSNLISSLPATALLLSSEPSGGAGTLPGPYLWPIHCHVVESIVLSTLWSPTCSRVPSESACAKYLLILFFLWGPDIRSRIIKYLKKSS